ncbi:3-phosphoglycerate dehydrogenase [Eubacterium minutum ATCC 700079]|nr:3-phosphoglycerate dehydrogenase [Eubacterium minutum ATCC 700079]
MYNIATLNKISPVGLARLTDQYKVIDDIADANGVLVRSQNMHDIRFPEKLLAIARAGAGVNNIPLEKCADRGIVVFNTPGANANAVKELVLAAMLMSARNIPAALDWVKTLTSDVSSAVEKGKKQFAGSELKGKTLGIVGIGAIGVLIANAAKSLGMNVIGYTPFLTIDIAHQTDAGIPLVTEPDMLLEKSDYISLNAPANPSTEGMVNAEFIEKMKDGAVLLNFARDKLVKEDDLVAALESGKISEYITDFGTDGLLGKKGVVIVPHLGASTAEAEDNCASIAADEIMDYIENGNIRNSVNFPNTALPVKSGEKRIALMTKGVENPVDLAVKNLGITVTGVSGGTKGDYGYALVSTTDPITEVPKIEGVIKTRIL